MVKKNIYTKCDERKAVRGIELIKCKRKQERDRERAAKFY